MIKIFVGGFPLDMDEIELVQQVAIYGEVSTIKIVRDKKTGKCKGYAFIEMGSREDAENAIRELNGRQMGDRQLTLNIVEEEINAELKVAKKPVSLPVYQKVAYQSDPPRKKRPRKTI